MNARARAARILAPVLQRRAALEIPSDLDASNRPLIAEICYGTLRHYPRLIKISQVLLNKPLRAKDSDVLALLLTGLYQLQYMRTADHAAISETVEAARQLRKQWACSLLNAALRRWQRENETLIELLETDPGFRWSLPDWLIERFQRDWPDSWQQIAEASASQAPMTLRTNLSRLTREQLKQQLSEFDIDSCQGNLTGSALRLQKPIDLEKLPAFAEGLCSVQDEAAQLCAELLAPADGMKLLDACSAPGGKTGHLLERAEIDLLALDISEERLQRVKENLQRLELTATTTCADAGDTEAWWDRTAFDQILLDAPCSGSGVMSRHPDIKLLRTATDVEGFAHRQRQMLEALWPTLVEGGRMLYCTCSVLPEENEAVVASFLEDQADAEDITPQMAGFEQCKAGIQLLPIAGQHDGFYYALLEKRAPE